MKKHAFILMALMPILSFSQLVLNETKTDVIFEKIYEVNKTKKEIHQKAMEWIAINFKDANEVVKLNTTEKVITKGNFNLDVSSHQYSFVATIKFIMEISFKENKYKLNMNSFNASIDQNEVGLYQYFSNLDFNNFVKFYEKTRDEAKDKFTKKYMDKLLANENELKSQYENSLTTSNKFTKGSSNRVETIADDLFNYINSKTDNDW
ncbi:DUF4468 domain-containing protein [Lutibacter sp.]|uniref:DUF4468 domain-containing protein n=1 Tax=Lutibacter sp. TaxID=1925666 RepID=UPI0035691E37